MNEATKAAAEVLRPAISDAAHRAVDRNSALDYADAAQITADVSKEVAAVVVNQSNQEPFYQSRVTIGAIMTLIGGSYSLVLDFTDGSFPAVDDLTAQVAAIIGAGIVLYGRWIASKPLGQ